MNLGIIGLGQMGLPIASRLLDAGYKAIAYDLNGEALSKFSARGGSVAASPLEVANAAETVLASLPTPAVILEVIGALKDGSEIKRFIDLSTTGAAMARRVSGILAEKGVTAIDAPVSGGVAGAVAGKLALMISCSEADFAAVEPVLKHLGRTFHVGAEPGLGQTMKLVNNFLSATTLAITGEAMVLGAKAGLDPAIMVEVINAGTGQTRASTDKFPHRVLTGSFDAGFTTGLMCKDLKLYAEEAEALEIPLRIGVAVREVWEGALKEEGPTSDFTTVVRPMERSAGVALRARGKKGR